MGQLRLEMGDRLGLRDPSVLAYVWVHRFPMFKWDRDLGRWDATHNPFSAPVWDEAERMEASTRFRFIAGRVAETLLERGSLSERELEQLLREAARDARRVDLGLDPVASKDT